mmetsp:Transcript_32915/g.57577  ORF Transcript_32915/g.57577 Transcript_32915/m.57577 type:complete len:148 (-) Transcript_32915:10084-10527(-)
MFLKTPEKPKLGLAFRTPSTQVKDSVRTSVKSEDTSFRHLDARSSTADHSKSILDEGELTLFDGFGPRKSASYEDYEESDKGPKLAWCAYCSGERSTEARYEATDKTFWSSLAIFLAGGVCGCFVVPYYLDGCKKKIDVCNKCGRAL